LLPDSLLLLTIGCYKLEGAMRIVNAAKRNIISGGKADSSKKTGGGEDKDRVVPFETLISKGQANGNPGDNPREYYCGVKQVVHRLKGEERCDIGTSKNFGRGKKGLKRSRFRTGVAVGGHPLAPKTHPRKKKDPPPPKGKKEDPKLPPKRPAATERTAQGDDHIFTEVSQKKAAKKHREKKGRHLQKDSRPARTRPIRSTKRGGGPSKSTKWGGKT